MCAPAFFHRNYSILRHLSYSKPPPHFARCGCFRIVCMCVADLWVGSHREKGWEREEPLANLHSPSRLRSIGPQKYIFRPPSSLSRPAHRQRRRHFFSSSSSLSTLEDIWNLFEGKKKKARTVCKPRLFTAFNPIAFFFFFLNPLFSTLPILQRESILPSSKRRLPIRPPQENEGSINAFSSLLEPSGCDLDASEEMTSAPDLRDAKCFIRQL